MPEPPIPECPEVHAIVTTDLAVHLILRVELDWEAQREDAVAELEKKTRAATAFASSPAFKSRYGARIGVMRVQTTHPPPSIVAHLLSEQGIELEPPDLTAQAAQVAAAASAPDAADRPSCSFCPRAGLAADRAMMTDHGWACPACFRAWTLKNEPQLGQAPRRLRIPPRFIVPLLVALAVVFAVFAYYELTRLNGMNQVIRQHMPRE